MPIQIRKIDGTEQLFKVKVDEKREDGTYTNKTRTLDLAITSSPDADGWCDCQPVSLDESGTHQVRFTKKA